MIKPQLYPSHSTNQTLFFLQRPFVHGSSQHQQLPKQVLQSSSKRNKQLFLITCNTQASQTPSPTTNRAITVSNENKSFNVKAIVKVKVTTSGFFSSLRLNSGIDDITDLLGKSLLLELVSSEIDSSTGLEKETIKAYAHKEGEEEESVMYETDFKVPIDFGRIGAILVENEHHKEMFLETIELKVFQKASVKFDCWSWVHSKFDNPTERIFFSNKARRLALEATETGKHTRVVSLSDIREGEGKGMAAGLCSEALQRQQHKSGEQVREWLRNRRRVACTQRGEREFQR